MSKPTNNQNNPKRDESVCYDCKYMAWMVAIGQGIRCINPESELTKNVQDRKDIALKLGLIPHRRHTCDKFEFKMVTCSIPDIGLNTPENMFEMLVDNVQVRGVIIKRSARDITVKIISPFNGLSHGRHIPYFAAHQGTYDGEYGDSTAKSLLNDIYSYCLEIHKNIEKLKKYLSGYISKIDGIQYRTGQLNASIFLLRKKMKDGLISSIEYQKAIQSLKKDIQENRNEIDRLFNNLVRSYITGSQSIGSDEQLREYISRL